MAQGGAPDRFDILKHLWNRGHDLFLRSEIGEKNIPGLLGIRKVNPKAVEDRILTRFSSSLAVSSSRFSAFAEFLNGSPKGLRSIVPGTPAKSGIPARPDFKALEEKLGMYGVFELGSLSAVTEQIEATLAERPRLWTFDTDRPFSDALPLTPGEQRAVDVLLKRVLGETPNKIALFVRQAPLQGLSTCVLALCGLSEVLKSYSKIYMVQPGVGAKLGSGSERELLLVMEDMGLRPETIAKNARPDVLIQTLLERNALLIMLSHHPAGQGLCRGLMTNLRSSSDQYRRQPMIKKHIVVLHEGDQVTGAAAASLDYAERALISKGKKKIKPIETAALREALFFNSLEIYENLPRRQHCGGLRLNDTTGYRINWCRHYLASDVSLNISAMEVRVLALFSANRQNFSFFDPTLGWDRLVGHLEGDPPLEIDLYHREIDLHFEYKVLQTLVGRKDADERSYWMFSTAVFWLRGTVLEEALRHKELFQGMAPITTLGFESLSRGLDHVSGDVPLPEGQVGFRVPMGLKAVAQERWIKAGGKPLEARRRVHDWVAHSLFKRRNDPGRVAQEFPFEADAIGSDRLYFRAEILRHKVRSLEGLSIEDLEMQQEAIEHADPNTLGAIENVYFGLFRVEINGNDLGADWRFEPGLAHQFGAFRLSAELHQLLEPWASVHLKPMDRFRFLRHVAYSCMDIGDLDGAAGAFTETTKIAGSLGAVEQCTAALDRMLLFAETATPDHVESQLAAAQKSFAKAQATDLDGEVESRLSRHLKTRKAGYRISIGDYTGAFEALECDEVLFQRTATETAHYQRLHALARLKGRSGHIFVDVCMGLAVQTEDDAKREGFLDAGLDVCLINAGRERQFGRLHSALGFEIQQASIYRLRGQLSAAEIILDSAYSSMLKTGGSIRTYLAVLEEAGRTLMRLNQPEKAYYLYLKRYLETCDRLGFSNRREVAIKVAHEALVAAAKSEPVREKAWRDRINEIVISSRVLSSEFRVGTDGNGFQAPYSGYWHPTGVSRYDEIDIGLPPPHELQAFERDYCLDS